MHEIFEHTADLGIRIRCGTLPELFAEAGQALFELLVENLATVRPLESYSIELQQSQLDLLLFDWLNELLYCFDARHLILCQFDVVLEGEVLKATVSGEPLDDARHHLDHEVKAITYHQLHVTKQADDSWLAEVILDI